MTADAQSLDGLRVEIDEIDDAIHERLIRRAEIVVRLKALKPSHGAPGAMRPAREAEILAHRLERHRGALPHAAIVGVWREIMAASLALQGSFSIAVCASRGALGYWDLARVHFGSAAPMRLYRSAAAALGAVERDRSIFAVLPMPTAGEADPWWPYLAERGGEGPWVVARLPLFEPAEAASAPALLVAHAGPAGRESALRLVALSTQGREVPGVAIGRCLGTVARSSGHLHLMEVSESPARLGDGEAVVIGSYTKPIRPSGP